MHGQHQQRDFVAAAQHAVIDLQHVKRRHQHQQIDDRAEDADSTECALERQERLRNFILWNLEYRGFIYNSGAHQSAKRPNP